MGAVSEPPRGTEFFDAPRLDDCHAVDHEPEEAARLAVQALDAVDGSLVGPILARARTMRAGMDQWSDLPTVRELDARLVVAPRG